MMKKICHLSSAHYGLDGRIFAKECTSLAAAGYATHLVISATAKEVEQAAVKGVQIHPLPAPRGRLSRMLTQSWRCYNIGRKLDADIYHFHDPELIPFGMLLVMAGKQVIYDIHEDLPKDIFSKEWIPLWARRIVSLAAGSVEYIAARYFFSIITATSFIAARFKNINISTVEIKNYPILSKSDTNQFWSNKRTEICYAGVISRIRGTYELVESMALLKSKARLNLCGKFNDSVFELCLRDLNGWEKVNEHGYVDRECLREILRNSMVGVVTSHPIVNYLDALPTKMFEYMAAGIPVISSNIPLLVEIIQGSDCGICVDPLKPADIAAAIDYLIDNPLESKRMGDSGRDAVLTTYNWQIEEAKLLSFYARISLQKNIKS